MSRNRRIVTRGTSDPKLTPLQEAIESDVRTDPAMSTEQRMDAVSALFTASGVASEIRQLPASNDPASDILAVVAESAPDMVVIGMRRRNPVGELIIGGTSQRIIRGVDCPVRPLGSAPATLK
jgi:nucleotide-binding universal stress UspA family protein